MAGFGKHLRIMEEVQAEVHQCANGRLAVDAHIVLRQVPAARADHDDRTWRVGAQRVGLSALRIGEGQGAVGGGREVGNRVDDVEPARGRGIFQVGQPDLRTGVQRVDGHLGRGGRACDLHAAVAQRLRGFGDLPVAGAHGFCFRIEVDGLGGGELLAAYSSGGEQLVAGAGELLVQLLDERQGFVREDLLRIGDVGDGGDFNTHGLLRASCALFQ